MRTLAGLVVWSLLGLAGETPAQPKVRFTDMLASSGITYRNVSGETEKRFIVSSLGSGAALLDYDEDGDLDIYFVNGSRIEGRERVTSGSNRLYRNDGDFRFVDVTDASGVGDEGWGLGCAAADYDNDGLTDIYVTNIGPNVLFRNRGDGTFDDVTNTSGVGDEGFGTSTLFFDPDGDGDLDLYAANYSEADITSLPLPGESPSCVWFGLPVFCGPSGLKGESDVFYRNQGDGTFVEATEASGLLDPSGAYGLGVVAGDVDGDGDTDLYVANDSVPNFLFENDGSGSFEEVALFAGVAYNADGLAQAGMGVDLADLDGDGRLDLMVTNFSHDTNTMYRNAGEGLFADATTTIDLRSATWFYLGWATRMADFDNDGSTDIFVANGHVYPSAGDAGQQTTYLQRNQLFSNRNGKLVEEALDPADALRAEASTRGAAFGDLDDDGDLDVVTVNIDDAPGLLRNETQGSSVQLRLIGVRSNRTSIAARVTATVGSVRRIYEVRPSGSFLSSNDARIHIGLGDAAAIDQLELLWPSGVTETIGRVEAGQHVLVEGRGRVSP